MEKLQPSRPFSGVGPVSVKPRGCISLPVTFGTAENFRTESVLFDVAEVSLPFNVILGRPALYQFMAMTHYGYMVLKMPSPNGVLKIRGACCGGLCAREAPGPSSGSSSCRGAWGPGLHATELAPARLGLSTTCATLWQGRCPRKDRPGRDLRLDRLPVSRVTWTANRNSRSSPSFRLMSTCLPGNHRKCLGSLGR
jgi:hypothetical protein